eukprot:NODE_3989_length_616_cov_4760.641975_g2827_i6.p1 GENE.NODE_3989_length_616_cov_4760.641975_g2827_i6~~NODE_3989_length_616_cov_4760.641975_g2827_i6.p1  ORF type:complete len:178 (+),score=43.81 NODE_3989_length_616_cov_4760.641975_g2827_i6:52-534(+)
MKTGSKGRRSQGWAFSRSDENAGPTGSLDFLLCQLRKGACLHDEPTVEFAHSKQLEIALGDKIDNGALLRTAGALQVLFVHHRQQVGKLNSGLVARILLPVEVTHTDLSEVTRMVLVHHDPVMMLTTSITATAFMFAMLADTPLAVAHVATHLVPLRLLA